MVEPGDFTRTYSGCDFDDERHDDKDEEEKHEHAEPSDLPVALARTTIQRAGRDDARSLEGQRGLRRFAAMLHLRKS